MSRTTQKLGSDPNYKRPKVTYQEQLTAEEIAEKLQGYQKVDNIGDVPLNTHIRYFITKDGQQVFRMGGLLQNKMNSDTYVYLSNGRDSWPVQVNGTIFFRKMSHKEEVDTLHDVYKKKNREKDMIIETLKRYAIKKGATKETIEKLIEEGKKEAKKISDKEAIPIDIAAVERVTTVQRKKKPSTKTETVKRPTTNKKAETVKRPTSSKTTQKPKKSNVKG